MMAAMESRRSAAALRALLVLAPLVGGGCASMAKYDKGYRYPYGATAADLNMIGLAAIQYEPEPEDANPFDFLYNPVFIPAYILDLPFSLVTDTITLPYDLAHLDEVGKPAPAAPAAEPASADAPPENQAAPAPPSGDGDG